ncbi:MAG: efflux transporter outer membrane subunit [Porphyromonadaceae bacterium]|nr:efflux transporter outer membrane subunit [Porphyromonadaceae bacterium]
MKPARYICLLFCTLLLTILSSCKIGKKYTRPEMELPEQLDSTVAVADSFSIADMHWWEIYADTILQNLIRQTLENNKDFLAAAARVKEMAASRRIDVSKILPQISGTIYAEKDAENYGGNAYDNDPESGIKVLVSWEVDLWGNLRWGAEKGKDQLQESIENQRALQVSLVAQVAQSYFELVALDHELSIVKQTLNARKEGVRLAKLRFEGGLTSETSFQQAQVELARTATLIPNLERSIATKENEISLLTGSFPQYIERSTNYSADLLPQTLPMGLPSSLLERRPDVRAAEKALMAANADVGIALTNMFPRITLTAALGAESDEISNLLRSPTHLLRADLLTPLFSMGRNIIQHRAKKVAYERSVYLYEKQVLTAFKDVRDAIVTYNKSEEVFKAYQELEQAAFSNNKLANLQYINGYISYLDVLDAQRGYFDAQISLSNSILSKQLAFVQLYKALGGGWQ